MRTGRGGAEGRGGPDSEELPAPYDEQRDAGATGDEEAVTSGDLGDPGTR